MSHTQLERKPERRKPLIADGNEVYAAAVIALAIGLWMYFDGMDWWFYIPAVIVSLIGFSYGIQLWLEDDRQYWKGWALYQQVNFTLNKIQNLLPGVQNISVRKNITAGITDAKGIIDELFKAPPTKFYGGLTDLSRHVNRLYDLEDEYVDIQDHPNKAGEQRAELMLKAEQGFDGFRQEMATMLEHANKGDIFNLTTNAELLRSLRNLLKQNS